jgi:hypothetical protein
MLRPFDEVRSEQMIEDNHARPIRGQHGTKRFKRLQQTLNAKRSQMVGYQHSHVEIALPAIHEQDHRGRQRQISLHAATFPNCALFHFLSGRKPWRSSDAKLLLKPNTIVSRVDTARRFDVPDPQIRLVEIHTRTGPEVRPYRRTSSASPRLLQGSTRSDPTAIN